MPESPEETGATASFSEREIAQDILTGQKYLSNYYYAPAILEAADPNIRAALEEAQEGVQAGQKQLFDYMNARGWYGVNQADNQSVNELRNIARESRQMIGNLMNPGQGMLMGQPWHEGIGGRESMGGQYSWTGTQSGEGQPGMGQSSLAQGARWQGQSSFQGGPGNQQQSFPGQVMGGFGGSGQGNQYGWTGTQAGEGQTGMGPSSLYQGARWQGQSTFQTGIGNQAPGQGFGGAGLGGQGGQGFGNRYGWTGTQYGEGQPGMGQSSLAQGARWVGQSTYQGVSGNQAYGQGVGAQGYGSQGYGGQGYGGQYGWTGTQAGEGQPGMGHSSLYQGARWQGQSAFQGNYGNQQSYGQGVGAMGPGGMGGLGQGAQYGWTGTQAGEGQPGTGQSSLAQGARWVGQSTFQGGPGVQQSFAGLPGGQALGGQYGWTGTQAGEGQTGMGHSSLFQGVRIPGQQILREGGQGIQGVE